MSSMRFDPSGFEFIKQEELHLPDLPYGAAGPILALDSDARGNLYLSDELNHGLFSIDATGTLRWCMAAHGAGPSQFAYPKGLAFGRLAMKTPGMACIGVADSWNRRIQFFDPYGNYLECRHQFDGLEYEEVSDVRFLDSGSGNDPNKSSMGSWLFLDRGHHRICASSETGRELHQVGRQLPNSIAQAWFPPGPFIRAAAGTGQGAEMESPFDPLYYPVRLLGSTWDSLHVWEPSARTLKKLEGRQLLPVPCCPAGLTEWIGAAAGLLFGWDLEAQRILVCRHNGELLVSHQVEGAPLASGASDGIWLRKGDHLSRISWARRGEGT